MNTAKIAQKVAANALKITREPLETLSSQASPFANELRNELFGSFKSINSHPRSIAGEELRRARQEKELEKSHAQDDENSNAKAQEIVNLMKQEYQKHDATVNREQNALQKEVVELQEEIAKLAKAAQIETKAHLQNPTNKVTVVDIKFLTKIVTLLRVKTEQSKSGKDLQMQRTNAKRTTGMLAWVSGKQMKVHEQGTLTLQG